MRSERVSPSSQRSAMLVAAIYHIAPVFLAVYQKPIALGNGPGAIFLWRSYHPDGCHSVHRTILRCRPHIGQSQRGET
jgi:hypothetical protein